MESENDIELVQTCGVCEEICLQQDIETHGCLKGYSFYTVDPNTLYFYPLADKNENEQLVEKQSYKNKSNIIQKTKKRKVFRQLENNTKKRTKLNENSTIKLNFDDEELIILEVQKRRPLWDYSLPLVQRKCSIKQKLWAEISSELNGKVNADEVQKKFKSTHDTFRKIIQSEQRPSGSARKDITQKWPHYESMSFLKDYCLPKITMSNINTEDNLVQNSSSINVEDEAESIQTAKKKGKNVPTDAIERIADAICKETNIVLPPLPPPPELNEVESFLALLGSRLRKMSSKVAMKTMQNILQLTYETLMQENSNE